MLEKAQEFVDIPALFHLTKDLRSVKPEGGKVYELEQAVVGAFKIVVLPLLGLVSGFAGPGFIVTDFRKLTAPHARTLAVALAEDRITHIIR